jgi:hypothetical protein
MQLFSNAVNRVRDMNSHKMMMMLAMKIMIMMTLMMMMIAMKIIIAMMIMITGMSDTCIITMIYIDSIKQLLPLLQPCSCSPMATDTITTNASSMMILMMMLLMLL